MLKLIDIEKTYDRKVLNGVNISFPDNGIVFIKGESGEGKTTLINIIAGFIKADRGNIVFNNEKIENSKMEIFRKNNISFMFQNYGIIDHLSIRENLLLSECTSLNVSDDERLIDELSKVNINKPLEEKCINLSGGEKQRIALARIKLNPKRIIILDEPSSSLDGENAQIIFSDLKKLSNEHLIIMVSHDNNLIEKYADAYYDLKENKYVELNEKDCNLDFVQQETQQFNLKIAFNLFLSNVINKKIRYIISVLSYSLVLIFSLIGILFSLSFENVLEGCKNGYLDYNKIQISLQKEDKIEGSDISLVSSYRPSYDELIGLLTDYNYELVYNIDYLFASSKVISKGKEISCLIKPVHTSVLAKYYNGVNRLTYKDFFINQSMFELCSNELILNIETSFITNDKDKNYALDNFIFSNQIQIVDVVNEFEFMQLPTLYYSYEKWVEFLKLEKMFNASKLLYDDITYYDRFSLLSNNVEDVSSYCFDLYVLDDRVDEIVLLFENNGYKVTSNALETINGFNDVFESIRVIILFFVIVSVVVLFFLIEIILYSFMLSKKKEIGVLNANGVSKRSLCFYNTVESVFVCLIGGFISLLFINFAKSIFNNIILSLTGINNFFIDLTIPMYLIFVICLFVLGIAVSIFPNMLIWNASIKELMEEV